MLAIEVADIEPDMFRILIACVYTNRVGYYVAHPFTLHSLMPSFVVVVSTG
jgi:hypothetical protein